MLWLATRYPLLATRMLDLAFFCLFTLLTLGGAVGTVALRSPVHNAVSLIVSLLGVAGLYLLQQAEFLFAAQIIVYVGGVMVLFLFVIMLMNLESVVRERQFTGQWRLALACVAGIGGVLVFLLRRGAAVMPQARGTGVTAMGNTQQLGEALFRDYLVPFEAASVLLLAAVVGAVLMAKRRSE